MLADVLQKKQPKKEIFSSLVLDEEYVAAALWEMGEKGVPHILSTNSQKCGSNTWEARLEATDEALAAVEDAAGTTSYAKVVLGLPASFLTPSGEITKDIRPHVKKITQEMELTAIGFVSIHQALMYELKKDEGVPPSVILLEVTKTSLAISLYRVGALAGQYISDRGGDIAIQLEELLKEFKDLEVLPARILLYGYDDEQLEQVKSELLRYPWTTRVNFLHFPKIEIVTSEDTVSAVSLAGASELARAMGPADEGEPAEEPQPVAVPPAPPGGSETEETLAAQAAADVEQAEEAEEGEEILEEEKAVEEPNVVVVDPARLGFRKNVDVLEEVPAPQKPRFTMPAKFPKISMPVLPRIDILSLVGRIPLKGKIFFAGIAAFAILIIGLFSWFFPRANVTILELPKAVEASEQLTIDSTATALDSEHKIIPGHHQEKSVSGEKTVTVTGKKKVGDPAKGGVTIYNKSLSAKTFSKGTVVTSGSLEFALDSDVPVASASESVGSITFGKANGTITARQIGTESNLPAGKEFSFKDTSTSVAIARNDAALTGGTSREVTVVSRSDYDSFVKEVSQDLIEKAKQELAAAVGGTEKLIDETIKTTVTEKTFQQELDQEATQLSGKLTITVSGTSYNEDDVKTLLKAFIAGDIPQGYTLAEERTKVEVTNVKVQKDGKVTAKVTIHALSAPTLDLRDIQKKLAGKTIAAAENYLRSLSGVAGVEIHFERSFGKSRLPMNAKNISVGLAIP